MRTALCGLAVRCGGTSVGGGTLANALGNHSRWGNSSSADHHKSGALCRPVKAFPWQPLSFASPYRTGLGRRAGFLGPCGVHSTCHAQFHPWHRRSKPCVPGHGCLRAQAHAHSLLSHPLLRVLLRAGATPSRSGRRMVLPTSATMPSLKRRDRLVVVCPGNRCSWPYCGLACDMAPWLPTTVRQRC